MIRISSGKYRSRLLLTPEEGTLPTKNRVREAMMSMVTPYIEGARVLDLFAGSGALGIEALSRGAKEAIFVDVSPSAAKIIQKNLDALKETHGEVICGSYLEALSRCTGPFDLVFLDPPYALKESYQTAVDALFEKGLLAQRCALILEYEGELSFNEGPFSSRRDYTYGKTKVILLRR